MYVRRPPKSMARWAATGRRQAAPTLRRVDLQPPPQGDRDARTDRGATLAGRRWGDRLSGWLVGLPLTSGPVVFFLAIDQGNGFATRAALAVLLGTISQAAFAVAYARAAVRGGWAVATIAGCTAFAIATIAFQRVSLPALPAFALVA